MIVIWASHHISSTLPAIRREGFAHNELHVQRKAAIAAAKDARLVRKTQKFVSCDDSDDDDDDDDDTSNI